jgi:tRNA dimethylallyltransferase
LIAGKHLKHQINLNKTLIVIAGPTASGKTALAIKLAQKYKTQILSADSRQFYREMNIGTAKPNAEELTAAPHHFINSHSVTENFSVGQFEQQALMLLDQLFETHNEVIMVGGSGLYVKAVCEGFDAIPAASAGVREALNQQYLEKGLAFLQEKLKTADPSYYLEVDLNNPQRLIRALEVFESTGLPFSSYRQRNANKRPFNIVKYGISLPREILYKRIDDRVDDMVRAGLLDEVKSLIPYRYFNALNTVGYSELFDYLDGKINLKDALSLIKQNTRHFAKRQLTWFKRDADIAWVEPPFEHLFS